MKTPTISSQYINTIPILLSSTIASIIVYLCGWNLYFSPLILGIIAGGLIDLDHGFSGRLKNVCYALIAFAISSLSVQLTYHHPILLTATFTLLAFFFTFSGAAGNRYRTIAFGTIAVSVYTTLTHDPKSPLYINTLFLLIGTILYSSTALLIHIIFPHRTVQENMANAYENLSNYLNAKAELFDPDEANHLEQKHINLAMANTKVIEAFNQCRTILFYRMRGQHRHPRTIRMLQCYFTAQDIHERISSSHVQYQDFAYKMRHSDLIYRIQRILRLEAQVAKAFATALRQNEDYTAPDSLDRAVKGTEESLQHYIQLPIEQQLIAPHRIKRLLDNITHVSHQFTHLSHIETTTWEGNSDKTRIQSPDISGFKAAWHTIKGQANVQSPIFRHAVRMALTAFICCIVIQLIHSFNLEKSDLSLGFWILLTAVFVCQPNYSATKTRLIQRILGTILGVLVGSALPILALTLIDKLFIATLATTLFFYSRTNKYSSSTFFITIQAMIGFSIMGFDITTFFIPRIIDTIIGAAIAGCATYFLWPDWKFVSLDKNAREAIESNGGYLRAVLNELHYGLSNDITYRLARRTSHDKAANLSSVLSDMSSDPKKHSDRLQQGFMLLKINYSLISYISALGAYRDKMHQDDAPFLAQFYITTEQVADLLENIGHINHQDFQAAHNKLQKQLSILRENLDSDTQNQTLWQQILMINELLPPIYKNLSQLQRNNHQKTPTNLIPVR